MRYYVVIISILFVLQACSGSRSTEPIEEEPFIGEPCEHVPTVTYEGKTYNTVQIGRQCWFRENLDVGVMILSEQDSEDNDVIEKYCYENDESNCEIYGGLYQWKEAMQYRNTSKGICPEGWHIPTKDDFEVLKDYVNDDGNSLKEIGEGSNADGAGNNSSGFSALLGGLLSENNFVEMNYITDFWSSTKYGSYLKYRYHISLHGNNNSISLYYYDNNYGYSIRCILDE